MNAAVIDAKALSALAYVVASIRPQWDAPGIRSALEKALGQHPYPDVALIAVRSARDPKAATPGVIPTRCANGWMATPNDDVKPPTPTPDRAESMRCPRCPLLVVRGEEHRCAPLATEPTDEYRQARAELAARPPEFVEPPEREVEDVEMGEGL